MKATPEMIEAAALKWATMDGKSERFLADKAGDLGELDGTYTGYLEEARQVLNAALAVMPKQQVAVESDQKEIVWVQYLKGYLTGKVPMTKQWRSILLEHLDCVNEMLIAPPPTEARIAKLEDQLAGARAFVERHPALTLIDLAEFEAFIKLPAIVDAKLKEAFANEGNQ